MGWDGDGMGWGLDKMGRDVMGSAVALLSQATFFSEEKNVSRLPCCRRHPFVVKTTCSAVALLPQTFFCWLYQKAHSAVALLPQALLLQKHSLAKLGYA